MHSLWFGARRLYCRSLFSCAYWVMSRTFACVSSCISRFTVIIFTGCYCSFMSCILWYMCLIWGSCSYNHCQYVLSFSLLLIRSSGRYWLGSMCFQLVTALESMLMLQRWRVGACPWPPYSLHSGFHPWLTFPALSLIWQFEHCTVLENVEPALTQREALSVAVNTQG